MEKKPRKYSRKPGKPINPSIFQLKIALKDARPPIWRRILVAGDIDLGTLHQVIQETMGWEDYHLHEFTIGHMRYGEPSEDDWEPVEDERRIRLDQLIREGDKFIYTYDFGDDWTHLITVEKILVADPKARYPVCIKGKRACPPEDCGGIWGYAEMLSALENPEHEEHTEIMEWLGGGFDPESFDPDEVNQRLQSFC
jgi:hypothetical protein